jgi:4-hydroxy-2,2'-bipyrrole-5-carbaldehyde O-methyltransferase
MRLSRAQLRGLVRTIRAGHAPARVLAISDSRTLVRSLFLASAVRTGLLNYLRDGRSLAEISHETGCLRTERLRAWLDVGTEVGEINWRAGRYHVHGRRARAIAAGDALLGAHYRSMLDYQTGSYADLAALLRSGPGDGRADLDTYADVIAQVSLAAAPFISSFLTRVVTETRPARILDVGCGTAVYSKIAASADRRVRVVGIALAEGVIDAARANLRAAGLAERIQLHTGDIRHWTPGPGVRYDLILLLNNIYYFPRGERVALYERLGGLLSHRGQLVVASLTAPGSVAAAHLNFMLTCQSGAAALPRPGELPGDLASAGFGIAETELIVPGEPFLAVRATRP